VDVDVDVDVFVDVDVDVDVDVGEIGNEDDDGDDALLLIVRSRMVRNMRLVSRGEEKGKCSGGSVFARFLKFLCSLAHYFAPLACSR
jgi:hypothetical protein